jgi:glucose-6-phosphate isomerase
MLKKNLVKTPEWQALQNHYQEITGLTLRDLFDRDRNRVERFSLKEDDIYVDYSKNLINTRTMDLLLKLAVARNLKVEIENMFGGQKVNQSENRAALHIALRNLNGSPVTLNGSDVMPGVRATLEKMKILSRSVREGRWRGFSNKRINHIVYIGIGGSNLGPRMVVGALEFYCRRNLSFHFVSNVDGSQIKETLNKINPEKTLFIIASKTFKTEETMTNAGTAKQWILEYFKSEKAVSNHFLAISSQRQRAVDFGIAPENILDIWDWVGGRFSVSSAIGLPVMMAIGYRRFMEFLSGFHWMDTHFREAPFKQNIPVILALLGIWYINFFSVSSQVIIPYDHYLRDFPAYLQQLEMESNGKSIDRNGQPVAYHTAPLVWGQPGTDGQHAFFQLFHQGTRLVACDFIGFCQSLNDIGDHHQKLISNFIAQTEALAFGKTKAELIREKVPDRLIPHKICTGNKPTTSILAGRLTPQVLGKLIAMYEHKVFVQGAIWNIFSFDQWGVELGKQLAGRIFRELSADYSRSGDHDDSTAGLIRCFKDAQVSGLKKD